MMDSGQWLPLESNPCIINKFLEKIGVSKEWVVRDLMEFSDDYLTSLPNPALAVLLLFPFSENDDKYCEEKNLIASTKIDFNDLYFMKQSTECACGTIALIHSIANKIDTMNLDSNAFIRKFINNTKELSPNDKESALINDQDIKKALFESCDPKKYLGEVCRFHYVTFVQIGSKLYELDGRKSSPIYHGETTTELFLKDCAALCKNYIQRDPNNLNFSALLLGAK